MKKNVVIVTLLFYVLGFAFAQNDLQAIAQVNLLKKEPITLAQLKKAVVNLENAYGRTLSANERKEVLGFLMGQKLLNQASEKDGIKVLDSEVNEFFNEFLSSQINRPTTEQEFSKMIKQEKNQSLDEFFKENIGSGVAEVKKMLKEQLSIQKYTMTKKSSEIQKMSVPTDGSIRSYYELNKQMFFRPDTMKLVIIGVLKKGNDKAESDKITELNEKVKKNIKNLSSVIKNAEKGNYVVQERYALKSAEGAQVLGLQLEALMQIFEKKVNFVSDINDMEDNRQFFVITDKYDAKILSLSDVIDPSQTITVYEYVKNILTSQMKQQALQQITQMLVQEIKTAENSKILKTDEELNKLLSW